MIWLLFFACGRAPAPPEVPAEAEARVGEARVQLRCAGAPDCQERAQAAAERVAGGDWAGAVEAAGPGDWSLRDADERWVSGAWPVEVAHPSLPEGQLLARFTLAGGAMLERRAEGEVSVAVADTLADAAAALEGGGGGWVLRCEENGVAHERGRSPHVQGLSLSP